LPTECNQSVFEFQALNKREVIGDFSGGRITSDGGGLLLREVEARLGIVRQFETCFRDYRDEVRTEHSVYELLRQRIYALALGYEDLNDHDVLRSDPLLAVMAGKADPTGEGRSRASDRGRALAGKSTLNRLELGPADGASLSRYKKIVFRPELVSDFFVDVFLQAHALPPEEIVLDLDATDDPLHGEQEGRFFHGYYDCYCYLPLYIFAGEHLPVLVAQYQLGAAVRAGIGLCMKAAVGGCVIFPVACRAHGEGLHRCFWPVVGDCCDDREAGAAVGAVDEWVPIATVGRVVELM